MTHALPSQPSTWQYTLSQAVLRVGGVDAASFLHSQFVSHVLRLRTGEVLRSAWCTPQGRVSFLFWLLRREEDFLIVLPASEITRLAQRLRLFVLRAKVEIDALSDWRVLGVKTAQTPAVPDAPGQWLESSSGILFFRPGPSERFIALIPPGAPSAAALPDALPTATEAEWLACDIEDGLVEVTGEWVNAFLPQQLNLDETGTIAFDKGCYPGQEIIARLKYRGQVKSRLMRGAVATALAPGTRLAATPDAPTGGMVLCCAPDAIGYRLLAVADLGGLAGPLRPEDGPDNPIHFATLHAP